MTDGATDNGYQLSFAAPAADKLQISLAGSWRVRHALPAAAQLDTELKKHPNVRQISFDSSAMTGWDSALLTFLLRVQRNSAGIRCQWFHQSCRLLSDFFSPVGPQCNSDCGLLQA